MDLETTTMKLLLVAVAACLTTLGGTLCSVQADASPDAWCGDDGQASPGNSSAVCRGARTLWTAVGRWLDSADALRLSDGVQIVKVVAPPSSSSSGSFEDGGGFLGRASKFASTHELRVRLNQVLPSLEDVFGAPKEAGSPKGRGRGKDKGGGLMAIAAMGMMMKGVLGAVGLGGAALLAMKALMVSMMALMLSAIVGVKKLSSGHDDGGTHHVQVVPVHHSGGDHGHYRRRRSDPYRAHRPS